MKTKNEFKTKEKRVKRVVSMQFKLKMNQLKVLILVGNDQIKWFKTKQKRKFEQKINFD